MCARRSAARQGGITLVEQIIFIVVVGVGVVGLLASLRTSLFFSADPQVKKQQIAVAEAVLAEILHQPFTYCDPDDANAATATISGALPTCALVAADQDRGGDPNPLTAPTAHSAAFVETRNGVAPGTQFDNVADYGGYTQVGVTGISGTNPLANYRVDVAVTRIGATYGLPPGAALQIAVTVTDLRDATPAFVLTGFRFRYAPRT